MKRTVCLILGTAVLSLPLLAQPEPPGAIAKIYTLKPKPGMEDAFEKAYKQHLQWHRDQNDTWNWDAWQYESGDRLGQYAIVTSGHQWADFDNRGEMGRADEADANQRLRPLLESVTADWSLAHYQMSRLPAGMPQAQVVRVTEYHLHPGKDLDFAAAISKANEALTKANWGQPVLWTQALTGTTGVFSAVEFHENWAGLQPAETSVLQALEEVLGHAETSRLAETFWSCQKSSQSYILRYRADLSYSPSGE